MKQIASMLPTVCVLAMTVALASACAPGVRSGDAVTTSSPGHPSPVAARATTPAPVPTVSGSTDGPGFGPGVGAGLDTGIGLQPSLGLVPLN